MVGLLCRRCRVGFMCVVVSFIFVVCAGCRTRTGIFVVSVLVSGGCF